MKKTLFCIVGLMITITFCIGCAAQQPATQPTEHPTVAPASTSNATPSPTPTPTPEPVYEIILMDAPEDFLVDERYIPIPYVDDLETENVTTDESEQNKPITLEDVIKTVMPNFSIYNFEDADGQVHYRAYGEKWLVPDGAEPIEFGMYAVTVTRGTMAWEMDYSVEPDAKPIPIEQDFPSTEANAQSHAQATPNPSSTTTPAPKPANGAADNGSGSDASGGNNNGGGNSPTPDPNAGKTWHDAVYEDVWIVDEPARTVEEPIYETREISRCTTCNADITGNEESHVKQHMMNGENGNWKSEVTQVQTGTQKVTIPEKGHWEKKLVREAGYY